MINATAEAPETADREAVTGELRRITDAPQFSRSPVMCRLLTFLVEQTLAGKGHRLKAYTIAVDALGRDADFDARIDSYPRVQVGRLRKLLDDFYSEKGLVSGLRVRIPKGAYIVEFREEAITPGRGMAVKASPSEASTASITDLRRFAAAALVALLIGLFAWQALGGLAHADKPLSGAEIREQNAEYQRCTKVIAADRCRELVTRNNSLTLP